MPIVICNRITCEHNEGYACNKERVVIHNDGECISRSLEIKPHVDEDYLIDDYDFKREII